ALASLPSLRQTLASLTSTTAPGQQDAGELSTSMTSDAERLLGLCEDLELDPALEELLSRAIAPEPAVAVRDGGVIAPGYDAELDELRQLQTHSGDFLVQ